MNALWLMVPLYAFAATAPLSVAAGNIVCGVIVAMTVALGLRGSQALQQTAFRRVLWALAAVLFWNAVSTLTAGAGARDWYKLGEEWWMKLLMIGVPVILAATGSNRHLRRLVAVLLGSGAFVAAYGVLQHFTGQDLVRHHRLLTTQGNFLVVGFTGHHLSFGGQLMYLLSMGAALVMAGRGRRGRGLWLMAGATLLMGLALVWTYARSSLLAVGTAAIFLAVIHTGKVRRIGLLVLAVGVLGVFAVPSLRGRMLETFTNPKEVTRLNLWRSSVSGIKARPVTGWGPGNFDRMLKKHEYPGYYEVRGHAHNDLLMQAVNAGVPGMLAFLWLYWEVFHLLWRGFRVASVDRGVIAGAMACQVAAMVGGMFQVFQTDDEPEMLLYFLLGCGLTAALHVLTDSETMGKNPR